MLSLGSASESHPGLSRVKNVSATDAIQSSHLGASDSSSCLRSQTPQAWLPDSSTSVLMNMRKKPAMSGSRTRRSMASCTVSRWIRAMHSARRRSLISRASASAHASAVAVRISWLETEEAVTADSHVSSIDPLRSNGPRSSRLLRLGLHAPSRALHYPPQNTRPCPAVGRAAPRPKVVDGQGRGHSTGTLNLECPRSPVPSGIGQSGLHSLRAGREKRSRR